MSGSVKSLTRLSLKLWRPYLDLFLNTFTYFLFSEHCTFFKAVCKILFWFSVFYSQNISLVCIFLCLIIKALCLIDYSRMPVMCQSFRKILFRSYLISSVCLFLKFTSFSSSKSLLLLLCFFLQSVSISILLKIVFPGFLSFWICLF